MAKSKTRELTVQNITFRNVSGEKGTEYICISDIAYKFAHHDTGADDLIRSWLRNKNTIEFLGVWESINNMNFNSVEFDVIKNESGVNRFSMSVKQWVERTNAIGIYAKTGRYGSGTFAHYDIALEFASWLSPELKLYIIKEFQRLKYLEAERAKLEWQTNRFLSKVNYRLQTDAIKNHILPMVKVPKWKEGFEYAKEADVVNVAMFGKTASEWRAENKNRQKTENIRDYASVIELAILSNLEHKNAELIKQGIPQFERLRILIQQANEEKAILQKNLPDQGMFELPDNTKIV
ncbi:MAG: KilA-N domain-containing protein [Elusimicrobiaceae bacterium]|nr:KilA-N domain-containing protein [Elusimicrobiaceae bacterium]